MFEDSEIPLCGILDGYCEKLWQRLGETGDWWSGAERVALAREVRRARSMDAGEDPVEPSATGQVSEIAIEAAHRIAVAPASPTREWIKDLQSRGLSEGQIVELAAIAGVTLTIDTTAQGIGAALPPFPECQSGEPARVYPDGAIVELPEMYVRTVPVEAATGSLREFYEISYGTLSIHDERSGKFYPIAARSLSLSPRSVWDIWYASEYYTLRKWISLTQQQLDLLGLQTSSYNSCLFCGSIFATSLVSHGGEVDVVCALSVDGDTDTGVPNGPVLRRFGRALLGRTSDLGEARRALAAEINPTAVGEAAFIVGSIHFANRQNDLSGVPLEQQFVPLVPAGATGFLADKSTAAKQR